MNEDGYKWGRAKVSARPRPRGGARAPRSPSAGLPSVPQDAGCTAWEPERRAPPHCLQVGDKVKWSWMGTHGLWMIPGPDCPAVRPALEGLLCEAAWHPARTAHAPDSCPCPPRQRYHPQAWDETAKGNKVIQAPTADGSATYTFDA